MINQVQAVGNLCEAAGVKICGGDGQAGLAGQSGGCESDEVVERISDSCVRVRRRLLPRATAVQRQLWLGGWGLRVHLILMGKSAMQVAVMAQDFLEV